MILSPKLLSFEPIRTIEPLHKVFYIEWSNIVPRRTAGDTAWMCRMPVISSNAQIPFPPQETINVLLCCEYMGLHLSSHPVIDDFVCRRTLSLRFSFTSTDQPNDEIQVTVSLCAAPPVVR